MHFICASIRENKKKHYRRKYFMVWLRHISPLDISLCTIVKNPVELVQKTQPSGKSLHLPYRPGHDSHIFTYIYNYILIPCFHFSMSPIHDKLARLEFVVTRLLNEEINEVNELFARDYIDDTALRRVEAILTEIQRDDVLHLIQETLSGKTRK